MARKNPSPHSNPKSQAFNLYLDDERRKLIQEAEAYGQRQEIRLSTADVVELALKRLLRPGHKEEHHV